MYKVEIACEDTFKKMRRSNSNSVLVRVILLEEVSVFALNFCNHVCTCIRHVQVYCQKIQVRFAFGCGPMIFDRVIPLELGKNQLKFWLHVGAFLAIRHLV
jgi:hypothetical protein